MGTDKLGRVCVILTAVFATCGAIRANSNTTPKPVPAQPASRPLSFEPNRGQTDRQVEFLAHGTGYGLFLLHGEAVMVLGHSATVRMRPAWANLSAAPEPLDEQPPKNKDSGYFSAFVTKFDAAGTALVYPTYLGGGQHKKFARYGTLAAGISVDGNGNAYVAGQTGDTDFPVKNAFQPTQNGFLRNGFVTKFDRAGALVYSSYLGGTSDDIAVGVAVDKNGSAYVTGIAGSSDFPVKNAFQNTLKGGDAFVTKISGR